MTGRGRATAVSRARRRRGPGRRVSPGVSAVALAVAAAALLGAAAAAPLSNVEVRLGVPGKAYVGTSYAVRWEGGDPVPVVVDLVDSNNVTRSVAVVEPDHANDPAQPFNEVVWDVAAGTDAGPLRARVYVLGAADPSAAGAVSVAAFTVNLATLTFDSPGPGAARFTTAAEAALRWTGVGDLPPMTIQVFSVGRVPAVTYTIGTTAANAAGFDWLVPVILPTSGGTPDYRARAVMLDGTGRAFESATAFQVRHPAVVFTYPTGVSGEFIYVGRPQNLTWETDGFMPRVNVGVFGLGGELVRLGRNVTNAGHALWDAPLSFVSDGSRDLFLRVAHADESAFQFDSAVFEARAGVRVLSPSAGDKLKRGSSLLVEWDALEELAAVSVDVFDSSCTRRLERLEEALEVAPATRNAGELAWRIPGGFLRSEGVGDDDDVVVTLRVSDAANPAFSGCSGAATITSAGVTAGASEDPEVAGINVWLFVFFATMMSMLFACCVIRFFLARRRKLLDSDEMVPELNNSLSSLTAFSVG